MTKQKIYIMVLTTYNDETRFARANTVLGLVRDYNKRNDSGRDFIKLHVDDINIWDTSKEWNAIDGKFDDECRDID